MANLILHGIQLSSGEGQFFQSFCATSENTGKKIVHHHLLQVTLTAHQSHQRFIEPKKV